MPSTTLLRIELSYPAQISVTLRHLFKTYFNDSGDSASGNDMTKKVAKNS